MTIMDDFTRKEYIEREAVCYQLFKQTTIDGHPRAIKRAAKIVADFPAADVAPVRHGRWINICGDRESPRQCSECLQDFDYIDGICYLVSGQRLPQYCPNCGARMDGDGDV